MPITKNSTTAPVRTPRRRAVRLLVLVLGGLLVAGIAGQLTVRYGMSADTRDLIGVAAVLILVALAASRGGRRKR